MDGLTARAIAETELSTMGLGPLSEWISRPLGSASVAQVHAARLKRNGRAVAIKVRRLNVHRFPRDLRAVRLAAAMLQALELDFDLVSGIEVSSSPGV
jgi:predicted unusual protein kinase regulating ubiquinone biosynthesis (AarF/ABC1/UbiB family)